jgi:hypothetical protein
LITALPDAVEVQLPLFTVKVYVVFAVKPLNVPVVPVPVIVEPPVAVTVHVPLDGRPLNATLPVAVAQVGWVIVPTTGALGVTGCALITALPDAVEVQLPLFTVKV